MRVHLTVGLDIEPVEDRFVFTPEELRSSAYEAVENALLHFQGVGFPREREAGTSIVVHAVRLEDE
jgi:hypothetical protein